MHYLSGCLLGLIAITISILVPIGLSAFAVAIFDWIFGTAYFSAPLVGGLALVLFLVRRSS